MIRMQLKAAMPEFSSTGALSFVHGPTWLPVPYGACCWTPSPRYAAHRCSDEFGATKKT